LRPTAVEVIRGIQGSLMGVIAPELQSMFAQDTGHTLQMLLESLANEWDTAADTLHRDNRRLSDILSQAEAALRSIEGREEDLLSLADDIGAALRVDPDDSLAISKLRARNVELQGLLERLLEACEDNAERPGCEPLIAVRPAIYQHLREVAGRGWSLWDMMSFRERMARLRAGLP